MTPALATFLIILKIGPNVGFAPLKVHAEVRVAQVEKGEVCIVSTLQGASCYEVGEGKPLLNTRDYTLKETDSFLAVFKYWHTTEKRWVTVTTPAQLTKIVTGEEER